MDGDEKILKALEVVFTKLGMSIPVIFKLRGFVLDNRFKISKSMTEGAFGKIYTGSDVLYSANEVQQNKTEGSADKVNKHSIVVKFTQSHAMNEREYDAHLNILNHTKQHYDQSVVNGMAQIYTKGKVIVLDPKLCTFGNENLFELQDDALIELFEQQIWSYMVLKRYGDTLEKYLFKRNEPFSLPCAIKIGLRLVE